MHKASGVWGQGSEDFEDLYDEDKINILSRLKGLMNHKYGDIIILVTMTAAFGMLLAISANG
jgi:hypothetical protein